MLSVVGSNTAFVFNTGGAYGKKTFILKLGVNNQPKTPASEKLVQGGSNMTGTDFV
jgi:hypothetical protein